MWYYKGSLSDIYVHGGDISYVYDYIDCFNVGLVQDQLSVNTTKVFSIDYSSKEQVKKIISEKKVNIGKTNETFLSI